MEKMTLLKFLTGANTGSRRFCFDLIINRQIKVNDKVIDQPLYQVNIKDKIFYNEKQIKYNRSLIDPVYIMMNKPREFICSVSDERDKPSLLNLIKHKELKKKHLFPVGRLDYLTEGLIFITNDGRFSNYLLRPKNNIKKHYYVEIKSWITDNHVKMIKKGIRTSEAFYKVEDIKVISAGKKSSRLILVLIEGKNREIRNIFAFLKYKIKLLKRVRIGPFTLDETLNPGEYKLISRREIMKRLPLLSGE